MTSSNIKVFIIDDDPVFSQLVESRLTKNGFNNLKVFESAESGLSALNQRPDFVILDFSLPGLNGLDTLKRIKRQRSSTQVVVFTTLRNEKLSQECLQHGAIDFLAKDDDASVDKIVDHLLRRVKKSKRKLISRIVFLLVFLVVIIYLLLTFM